MARALIVGCGCRGRALAAALAARGLAVRGTSRDSGRLELIRAAGAEPADADPDRLGTLMPRLEGVSAVCWLLGSATGPSAADLHGGRLETLLERIVDTPVRGFVYEAGGTLDAEVREAGVSAVRAAEARWHVRVAVVHADPRERAAWLEQMTGAVNGVLG